MMMKTHHYPSLNMSPWPILASLNGYTLLLSLLLLLKSGIVYTMAASMTATILGSMMWWYNYTEEFKKGEGSFSLESTLKTSMILFISSEIFFFSSFFWSYFHYMTSPTMETSAIWPPVMVESFDFKNIPLVNTLVLLFSGATITMGHSNLIKGEQKKCLKMTMFTIMLGVAFTTLQVMEYSSSFFTISDSNFGSTFFMLTGFHGIHVLIGFTFLIVVLKNMNKNSASKEGSLSFELASWYWHFVDVVWLVVFYTLYYLNT